MGVRKEGGFEEMICLVCGGDGFVFFTKLHVRGACDLCDFEGVLKKK
jgi:hypothetical protein